MKITRILGAAVVLHVLPVDTLAQAQVGTPTPTPTATPPSQGEDTDRENAMFGEEPTEPTPASTTESTLAVDVAKADDPLDIGGRLYMRLMYSARDAGEPEDQAFSNPNLFDLYFDSQPSDRVRAFAGARLYHDPTIVDGDTDPFGRPLTRTRVAFDQVWLKTDVGRRVFVTAGQQRIKWGASRIWNPTDFLNRERRDPLAVFDERLGVNLIKVHLPWEERGWNLYAVGSFDDAQSPRDVGGALRSEILLGTTETSLSAAWRNDQPQRFGADVSTAIGVFDVRVEGAVLHNLKTPFYDGPVDLPSATYPTPYTRENDWIAQVSAGGDVQARYSDQDSVFIGLEYFFNDAGYSDPDLYPWLFATGAYSPFYVGRNYASAFVMLPSPGTWDDTTLLVTNILNLSDNSNVTRFDVSHLLHRYITVSAFVNLYGGERGEFRFSLDVPPTPAVPGLENGLTIAPPILDTGLWLSVAL